MAAEHAFQLVESEALKLVESEALKLVESEALKLVESEASPFQSLPQRHLLRFKKKAAND
jgi:hypothetical protein